MKQVKALVNYRDLQLGKVVLKGEVFEVEDARAELLISKKYVSTLDGEVKEKQEKPVVKTKELKTNKKTK